MSVEVRSDEVQEPEARIDGTTRIGEATSVYTFAKRPHSPVDDPAPDDAPPVDLSVILVSYNTVDLLRDCLKSVYREAASVSLEVIVVDNDSSDGSADMVAGEFPDVRLVRNSANVGFSVANNAAMACALGKYLLLLNSDTVIRPGTFEAMIRRLEEDPEVGIAGCRLVRPSGEMDYACRRSFPTPLVSLCRLLRLNRIFPRHRLFGRYNLTYLDERTTYEVDSIVGAFMLVRRRVAEQVGGLDEDYFMYGEDIDWCYRAKLAGWKVLYVGECGVLHHKGASARKESFRMNYHFHRAMLLFHRKHLSRRYPLPLNLAIYLGIFSRFTLLALNHLPAKALASRKALTRPGWAGRYSDAMIGERSLP